MFLCRSDLRIAIYVSGLHSVVKVPRAPPDRCERMFLELMLLGIQVHTHLKGRIFNAAGTSYLVLSQPGERPEWLKVKALNAARTVHDMHSEEVERLLAEQQRRSLDIFP